MLSSRRIQAVIVLGMSCMFWLAGGASAGAAGALPVDLQLGVDFVSRYVWRGQLLTDDPVIQPDASISWKRWTLDVWASVDATDIHEESGREYRIQEIDYTLKYGFSPAGGLDIETGWVTYTFPGTGGNTTGEVYVLARLSKVFLQPTLTVYYDFDEVDGFYGNLEIGRTFPLPAKLGLRLGARLGWADSDSNRAYFGVDRNALIDVSAAADLTYAIGDRASLTLGFGYTAFPVPEIRDGASARYGDADNLVVRFGFTVSF